MQMSSRCLNRLWCWASQTAHHDTRVVGWEEDARRSHSSEKYHLSFQTWLQNAQSVTRRSTSHDGRPYCHKPCYAALFGPKGVNIGGAGSYVYDAPANNNVSPACGDSAPMQAEEKKTFAAKPPSKAGGVTTFSGEANLCPRCNKKVYFAEKVTSLGKDWHRPCLRCERCSKTLSAGGHAEHDGQPYCHKPCYAVLFGPKGVNTGGVGSYIYEPAQ
ncbi:cysteine-rich protein 2 isoform X2 [Phyllopteryx taeniolatus]|uniref:cysteine-rich protein 2 isoform X2 n=1 Tax=Phyllopteryx taeniolatus TaxID=161469 RepID=UPI002AD33D29|nr:cysteine-rich protein 2 isoform X2 [Phyllopteryx taeniolatus]